MNYKKIIWIGLASSVMVFSCNKKEGCTDPEATNYDEEAKKDDGSCVYHIHDEDTTYEVPSKYEFTDADGNSTVSYSGQTDRLNMLAEMKTYMSTGNTSGTVLDAQKLRDMFANENSAFTDADLNASSKQLESKCFSLDVDLFKAYFDSLATISASMTAGSNGVAGVVTSSNGDKKYLQSATGWEYTQIIEKGLMGAVLYYQIAEVYTREGKIGEAVNNSTPVDVSAGEYYTEMEHHWDEAFGYYGVPVDFPTNTSGLQFIGSYSDKRNAVLGSNQTVMDAYLNGRAAISNDDATVKETSAIEVREGIEKIFAASAIHYLNEAKTNIADDALRNHVLSEALGFLRSLKYNSDAKITTSQITEIETKIGTNFYEVTSTGLTEARDQLSSIYGMDDIKDQL